MGTPLYSGTAGGYRAVETATTESSKGELDATVANWTAKIGENFSGTTGVAASVEEPSFACMPVYTTNEQMPESMEISDSARTGNGTVKYGPSAASQIAIHQPAIHQPGDHQPVDNGNGTSFNSDFSFQAAAPHPKVISKFVPGVSSFLDRKSTSVAGHSGASAPGQWHGFLDFKHFGVVQAQPHPSRSAKPSAIEGRDQCLREGRIDGADHQRTRNETYASSVAGCRLESQSTRQDHSGRSLGSDGMFAHPVGLNQLSPPLGRSIGGNSDQCMWGNSGTSTTNNNNVCFSVCSDESVHVSGEMRSGIVREHVGSNRNTFSNNNFIDQCVSVGVPPSNFDQHTNFHHSLSTQLAHHPGGIQWGFSGIALLIKPSWLDTVTRRCNQCLQRTGRHCGEMLSSAVTALAKRRRRGT